MRHCLNCDMSPPLASIHAAFCSLISLLVSGVSTCVPPCQTVVHQPCLIRSVEASPTIIIVPYLVCLPSSVGWSQRHSLHCVVSWGTGWLLFSVRKEPLRWKLVPVHMWLPSGLCCGCSGRRLHVALESCLLCCPIVQHPTLCVHTLGEVCS